MYYTLKQLKEFVDKQLMIRGEETPIVIYYMLPEEINMLHPITGEVIDLDEEQTHTVMQEIGKRGEPLVVMNEFKEAEISKFKSP